MKYVLYIKNSKKVINLFDEEPDSLRDIVEIARCEVVPTISFGEYYEIFNIQENTEVYIEGDIEKTRTYLTCELRVVDKPNKAQLIEEKQAKDYENKIVALIRKKYSLNAELAILRQRDTKPEEYAEYFNYVEECKAVVKASL